MKYSVHRRVEMSSCRMQDKLRGALMYTLPGFNGVITSSARVCTLQSFGVLCLCDDAWS